MKKLMVLVALVAAAVSANAASYAWQANAGRLFDGNGTATENRYAGTGYLFAAGDISEADILKALAAGTIETALKDTLVQNTFVSGRATSPSDAFEVENLENAYFVVTSGDAVYISDYASIELSDVGNSKVLFGSQNQFSSAGFKDATAGYQGAGWYQSTADVPEPTSGLMLLLGFFFIVVAFR